MSTSINCGKMATRKVTTDAQRTFAKVRAERKNTHIPKFFSTNAPSHHVLERQLFGCSRICVPQLCTSKGLGWKISFRYCSVDKLCIARPSSITTQEHQKRENRTICLSERCEHSCATMCHKRNQMWRRYYMYHQAFPFGRILIIFGECEREAVNQVAASLVPNERSDSEC
eukprot:1180753-Prorocentrum_minimum.AAC.2